MVYAHRASYEARHGAGSANGLMVRHTCDNPICVNPDHLLLGTNQDNMDDMVKRGRSRRGEKQPQVKITEAQAIEILGLLSEGVRQSEISRIFNIEQSAVSNLKTGKNWGHLPRPQMPPRDHSNKAGHPKNTSGHRGVSFDGKNCKWVAYGNKNNHRTNIGRFDRQLDAIAARLRWEAENLVSRGSTEKIASVMETRLASRAK